MKSKLLTTVAATALIGFATIAVAQTSGTQSPAGSAPVPGGAQQHQPGGSNATGPAGGAMKHPQPGNAMKPAGGAQNQMPQSTPEQKSSGQQQPSKSLSQDEERNKSTTQRGAPDNDRGRTGAVGNEERHENTAGGHEQRGRTAVNISPEQRTRIKDVIVRDRNVARVPSANFSVSVGAIIPRNVHVAVLPSDVVTIVPEYRGFEYVVIGDQLLIIDPDTMEIVAILPA